METRERTADAAADLDPAPGAVPVRADPPGLVLTGWRWECVVWLTVVLGAAAWCTRVWARDLGWFQTADGTVRGIAGMAAIGIVVGVLAHPVRWRHAFWMDARGVTQWYSDQYPFLNEWTHIAWNKVREVQVHHRGKSIGLSVLPGDVIRTHGVGLRDRRGRPETVAFIDAVVREGERHPRVPWADECPPFPVPLLKPYDPAEPREGPTLMERFVRFLLPVMFVPAFVSLVLDGLGLSFASVPREYTALVLVTLFTGFRLWLKLHDSDMAYADRGGRSFRRWMRNRLRRLLGIRHV